jgi:hypothetical protein
MYKLVKQNSMGVLMGYPDNILRVEDNSYIPYDEANTDYQKYLAWLEEGNTPLPADE